MQPFHRATAISFLLHATSDQHNTGLYANQRVLPFVCAVAKNKALLCTRINNVFQFRLAGGLFCTHYIYSYWNTSGSFGTFIICHSFRMLDFFQKKKALNFVYPSPQLYKFYMQRPILMAPLMSLNSSTELHIQG
jgi:hypothetical protein